MSNHGTQGPENQNKNGNGKAGNTAQGKTRRAAQLTARFDRTHQNVEAAELVAHPRHEGGDGRRVGHIEPAELHGAEEPLRPERGGGGLPARLVPRREHHGKAQLCQPFARPLPVTRSLAR
jgi:hypothetical protein